MVPALALATPAALVTALALATPAAVVTTLALIPATAEQPELLHGLLASQSELELEGVQEILRAAQDEFTSRISLNAFTQTLTAALGLVHSFEATYYLLYQAAQTVQATWATYDRVRLDPIHVAFCKAMQLKTAAYMRFAVASCVKVRELPRALMKLGVTVQTLCTVTKSVDGKAAEVHVCRGTLDY